MRAPSSRTLPTSIFAAQQRQQPHADARSLNRDERLIAESWRVAEARRARFERDPREYRQLQVAAQRQLASGLAARPCLLDIVAIVVRIDEQDHQQQCDANQGDEAADNPSRNLERSHRTSSQVNRTQRAKGRNSSSRLRTNRLTCAQHNSCSALRLSLNRDAAGGASLYARRGNVVVAFSSRPVSGTDRS